jgi:hypothetical protein
MFKLWKSKPQFKTIRAENLQVGDQFVWTTPVEVKEVQALDTHSVFVTIEYINTREHYAPTVETVQIYRELLIIVTR